MNDQRLLITGAAGRIGGMLRTRLARPGRSVRLLDRDVISPLSPNEEFVRADVTDGRELDRACAGVDVAIHLAGIATEAPWEDILRVNIEGTYQLFDAARRNGVRRVVFASSNHAVGYFPRDNTKAPDYLFPAPDTYYGVSKVTGEALGALYHHRYGLEVVCLRILSCFDRPQSERMLATWLSPDDAGRLFEAATSHPDVGFRVVWGVSANTRAWFSMDEAHLIGYEPEDDAEVYAADPAIVEDARHPNPFDRTHLGGFYASPEFDQERLQSPS